MKNHYRSLQPLVLWRKWGGPLDWNEVFGRDAPRVLEIGCGNGDYLARYAAENPDRDIVGLDVRWGSVRRSLRRVNSTGLGNARLLLEDAAVALERLFPPASLHLIYCLFPCPWRKDKHEKHRLFSTQFLQLIRSRLTADAEGAFVFTDWQPYRNWIEEQIPGSGVELEILDRPPRFATKYERKWMGKGQDVFYELRFRPLPEVAIPAIPRPEEFELLSPKVPAFDPEQFVLPSERGAITVEGKELVFDAQRKIGMLRVVVVEDNLHQEIWLRIAFGKQGWAISPASGTGYVPTAGVQRALEVVAAAVSESAPTEPS